jgi:hypothetical protein
MCAAGCCELWPELVVFLAFWTSIFFRTHLKKKYVNIYVRLIFKNSLHFRMTQRQSKPNRYVCGRDYLRNILFFIVLSQWVHVFRAFTILNILRFIFPENFQVNLK